MNGLYIASVETYSGKTAVALGLALELRERGLSVGYLKPVGALGVRVGDSFIDADAQQFRDALSLTEPWESLCPVVLSSELIETAMTTRDYDARPAIAGAFQRVSRDKDLVLIEGGQNLEQGLFLQASAQQVVELVDSPTILVIKLTSILAVDKILQSSALLGDRLAGVLFVSVPRSSREALEGLLVPYLERKGVATLGVLPRDRTLMSVTVAYLRDVLGGEILCAREQADKLVETFLVGAMGQERALRFFRAKANKAVITGGDRADIQMAALETPTRCLVLTGNMEPPAAVLGRAEELGIPIILVPYDTLTTTAKIEAVLGRMRLDEPQKVERMRALLAENLNFPLLGQTLGIELG